MPDIDNTVHEGSSFPAFTPEPYVAPAPYVAPETTEPDAKIDHTKDSDLEELAMKLQNSTAMSRLNLSECKSVVLFLKDQGLNFA